MNFLKRHTNASSGSSNSSDQEKQMLQSVLAQQQEAYDDFVGNFTQLTHGDIERATTEKRPVVKETKKNQKSIEVQSEALKLELLEAISGVELAPKKKSGTEELEEEVLPPGKHQDDYLSRDKNIPLKLGNFVEEAQSDSESDEDPGYLPSALEQPSAEAQPPSEAKVKLRAPKAVEREHHFDDDKEEEEDGSDVLLPDSSSSSSLHTSALFVTTEVGSGEAEVPCSGDGNVRREPEPTDPATLTYPGEADAVDDTTEVRQHVTNLTMRVVGLKGADDDEGGQGSGAEDEPSDAVQPFKLDANFDYDNVKLTPKFTTEEWQVIKQTNS